MAQAAETRTKETGGAQPPPLRITRNIHARRATVFRAWCAGGHVSRWFAPETLTVPEARIEPRVGGAWDVMMRMPNGVEHWTRGVIRELKPDERIVIEMRVEDGAGAPLFRALTEVDFTDTLGGTRLDIMQTYTFENPAVAAPMVAGASAGWGSSLTKMEAEAIRMQGGSGVAERSVVHATFHLERTYAAPAERVWKALTDPAAKARWFGPQSGEFEILERQMDVREGGVERMKGRFSGAVTSTFDATYLDLVANERLVYSYVMHMDDKKISVSLATMQLKQSGGKTTLSVTEQGAFLDGYDDAGSREHGTGLLLDQLGDSLND
jgi:uncharacterized protein YndB with AHSA1/START domain